MKFDKRFIISVIILIVIMGVSFLLLFFNVLKKPDYQKQLSKIDNYLVSGNYDDAIKELTKISGKKLSTNDHKKFLKRIYFYTQNTNDFEFLAKQAIDAVKKDSTVKLFQDLCLYAFSHVQPNKEQAAILDKITNKRLLVDDFMRLASINLDNDLLSNQIAKDDSELSKLLSTPDPELYFRIFEATDFKPFIRKAAALYMKNAQYKRALEIAIKHYSDFENPLLASYIAFDNKNFDLAGTWLEEYTFSEKDFYLQLYKADILYNISEISKTGLILDDFIKTYPDYSWKPYYDLFVLSDMQGYKNNDEIQLLDSAMKNFGNNGPFIRAYYYFLSKNNKSKDAEDVILNFLKNNPNDIQTLVYYLKKSGTILSPQQLIFKSFELLESSNDYDSIGSYLAWLLINTSDLTGLIRLSEYKGAEKTSWYFPVLLRIYFLDPQSKIEKKLASLTTSPIDGLNAYYAGLYHFMKNDIDTALGDFELAIADADNKIKALACLQIAKIYSIKSNKPKALDFVKKGMNHDPENLALQKYFDILYF